MKPFCWISLRASRMLETVECLMPNSLAMSESLCVARPRLRVLRGSPSRIRYENGNIRQSFFPIPDFLVSSFPDYHWTQRSRLARAISPLHRRTHPVQSRGHHARIHGLFAETTHVSILACH